jgi:hypothetical protein
MANSPYAGRAALDSLGFGLTFLLTATNRPAAACVTRRRNPGETQFDDLECRCLLYASRPGPYCFPTLNVGLQAEMKRLRILGPAFVCLCSKPNPITECRYPRPRQSAMLRNLSVLGIRSPVIVTIESHDLDRRPGYGRCPAQRVERGISSKRPPDRLSLWLRPREVRSGDAAHRPREMRRSCQPKAVGYDEDPDSLYLATDPLCSGDNNEGSS